MSKTKKLLVIGGVAAGLSAAAKAKRTDKNFEITVLEKGAFISYGACGLPYYISDVIKDHNELIVYTPAYFQEKRGIKVLTQHEALSIDPNAKEVIAKDVNKDKELTFQYDKLVIATGASPVKPPMTGIELPHVFVLRELHHGLAIKKFLIESVPKKAVIVGAGYIGMEMAEAFRHRGMEVTIVELLPNILGTMDDEMNAVVEEELAANNVKLLKGTKVTGFEGDESGGVKKVVTDTDALKADCVLVSTGVKANAQLAQAAGITIGETGAIACNTRGETNIPDVYAAGDCAEAHHLVLDKPTYIPLGSTANKQGKVAGDCAAGGQSEFPGIVGSSIFKVFDLEVGRTGLTEREALKLGLNVKSTTLKGNSRAHYYPGAKPTHIKLVFDAESSRLLGAQVVSKDNASRRIDVLAMAVMTRMTLNELTNLDLSYAPPFSPALDPVLVAASVAMKK